MRYALGTYGLNRFEIEDQEVPIMVHERDQNGNIIADLGIVYGAQSIAVLFCPFDEAREIVRKMNQESADVA